MREDRIIQQLDKMVAAGQVTEEEAERLRATQGTGDFASVLGDIRARHASVRLEDAVRDGVMDAAEAAEQLERLRSGEHPKGLRARLSRHRSTRHSEPVADRGEIGPGPPAENR